MSQPRFGWVPERSIGHAWKACVPQGTEGSNPSPSVLLYFERLIKGRGAIAQQITQQVVDQLLL